MGATKWIRSFWRETPEKYCFVEFSLEDGAPIYDANVLFRFFDEKVVLEEVEVPVVYKSICSHYQSAYLA